ncbi:MAG: endopeptidase La [Lewinellaceae bacterium]|nr:endopeptidase La [Saprospiraceae bacterium]MCB9338409.1 endopeptidase La [Lewinellaceae bacterium]
MPTNNNDRNTTEIIEDEEIIEDDGQLTGEDLIEEGAFSREIQPLERSLPNNLTILPIFQKPVFPGVPLPMTFSGEDTINAIREAIEKENSYIGLVLARPTGENGDTELHQVGTIFQILRYAPVGQNVLQVIGQGIGRFVKQKALYVKPHIKWEVEYRHNLNAKPSPEMKAYLLAISSELKELLKLNPLFKEQINLVVSQLNYEAPGLTMDVISTLLTADSDRLQELLETFDLFDRANLLLRLIKEEVEVAKIQQKIQTEIDTQVNKQQKEFFLRQQLSAIKKELGIEKEESETEIDKVEKKLEGKKLSEEAQKVVDEELEKLKTLNAQSPEFAVTRNYIELIADLPWGVFSDDNKDLKKARQVLDHDHYGLKDVKALILEFLAAVIKRGSIGGSIICLVGPPGVGKTSIGQSIADALGRKFFRFSVGGMRDEAEIKGHRRTYIGAMPGKLIQALKRVAVSNPVIMLDEIDKIGVSYQGDPASALLEVLDPAQNASFLDHYLDIPYDLSKVLFVTTANQLDTIPEPLLDRMEVIRLSGYILEEKVQIAKQYLIPRQLKEHGFKEKDIKFSDDAIALIADKYAREAGVRNLEKQIRKIVRKATMKSAEEGQKTFTINAKDIEAYLGKPVFTTEKLYPEPIAGVVLGLAYTAFGGATLYIEAASISKKGGGLKLTGQLGNVMQESAEIAYSYIRSLLSTQEPPITFFDDNAVHLHVPAGATPKDGPSAGVTMALALYSLATNRPIKDGLAMTGELTLTGKVLPIGGVKEKTIAARRVGIQELIFPIDNKKDFEELPDYIREGLKVHFADYFQDVLQVAYGKRNGKK